jgi:hypothetical protein
MGAPWRILIFGPPDPTVSATSTPRTGVEHASLTLDTTQIIGSFGPAFGSSAFTGFGAAEDIADFGGAMLTVTNNYRVTALSMSGGSEPPSVLVRTYLAYFNASVGFLGYGGISGDYPGDIYPTAVTPDYVETSYSVEVPNFGIPVTSVEFSIGLIAPSIDGGGFMTGDATVEFDDVSLTIDIGAPGDFNGDGTVNGDDFLEWQRGESPNGLTNDDLDEWKAAFAPPIAAVAATSVPEPTGLALAALAICGRLLTRRARRVRRT